MAFSGARSIVLAITGLLALGACSDSPTTRIPTPSTSMDARAVWPDAESSIDASIRPIDSGESEEDAGMTVGTDAGTPIVDAGVDCLERKTAALEWPTSNEKLPLPGELEFGQTHVSRFFDARHTPMLIEERSTLMVFTPADPVPSGATVFVRVLDGTVSGGVLKMSAAGAAQPILEQKLSSTPLAQYSSTAHSVVLPWHWVKEGYDLEIGYADEQGDKTFVHEHSFIGLSAPHRFTVTRAKLVLFGETDYPTETKQAVRILRDFYGSTPTSTMRWVDYLPWRLDSVVITSTQGPQLISSEAEHDYYTDNDHHWSIIKNQFALRLNLSNTGRGLSLTRASEGDNSPYSFGTSVGMGWFRRPDGVYQDLDDAPWAAGWTGWTAMWHNECGNGFIHEVGHSFTLAHFTGGTAERWGIGAEYPQDGTNVQTHPWGYDNVSNQLRTWYRVDNNGPVMSNGDLVGKRDPMNGGESPNSLTCFPQYTAYHAWKSQNWMVDNPTIMNGSSGPGVYRWDRMAHEYTLEAPPEIAQTPTDIDVQVVTVIGTLGRTAEVMQTYPALHAPSGNVFDLPDPFSQDLASHFTGARYFLEIVYANRNPEFALIARSEVTDDQIYLYALNIRADKNPSEIRLHRSDAAYPNIQSGQSTVLHTRTITVPAARDFEPVLEIGKGELGNRGLLKLEQTCEPGINCDSRSAQRVWRRQNPSLGQVDDSVSFNREDMINLRPNLCGPFDQPSTLLVPIKHENGTQAQLKVHGFRTVEGQGIKRTVAIDDATDWVDSPYLEQGIHIWIPHSETASLAPGRYRTDPNYRVMVQTWDTSMMSSASEFPLEVNIEVLATQTIDLSTQEFVSASMMTNNSSMYFLPRDPGVGPSSRVWWNDSDPSAPLLTVPVKNTATGQQTVLYVRAQHQSCGSDRRDLHAGEASRNCAHEVVLFVDSSDNPQLVMGEMYETNDSMPLVIDGRRWHEPNNHDLVGTVAVKIMYQH